MKSDNQGDKEETFIQTTGWGRDGQLGVERICSKATTGGLSKVVDCGAGWAKLQLAGEAAAGGPGDRPHNPEFQDREIKPQTTD